MQDFLKFCTNLSVNPFEAEWQAGVFNVCNSIQLKGCLKFTRSKLRSMVSYHLFRQPVCCKQVSEDFNSFAGCSGLHGDDFRPAKMCIHHHQKQCCGRHATLLLTNATQIHLTSLSISSSRVGHQTLNLSFLIFLGWPFFVMTLDSCSLCCVLVSGFVLWILVFDCPTVSFKCLLCYSLCLPLSVVLFPPCFLLSSFQSPHGMFWFWVFYVSVELWFLIWTFVFLFAFCQKFFCLIFVFFYVSFSFKLKLAFCFHISLPPVCNCVWVHLLSL